MAKCKNCTNLYNLSDENDVIVGKWCPKTNDSPDVEAERDCVHYKCMTQGDHIRSMSDEELADFIRELNEGCLAGAGMVDCSNNTDCIDCKGIVLEWLQSEVEETR